MIKIVFNRRPMFDGELFIDANQSFDHLRKNIRKLLESADLSENKITTICTYLDVKTVFGFFPRMFYSWELETWTYDEKLMKDVEC